MVEDLILSQINGLFIRQNAINDYWPKTYISSPLAHSHFAFLALTLVGAVSPASYLFVSFLLSFNQGHTFLSAGDFDTTSLPFLLVFWIAICVHLCMYVRVILVISWSAGQKSALSRGLQPFVRTPCNRGETHKEPGEKNREKEKKGYHGLKCG